jgi:hypothetical protein
LKKVFTKIQKGVDKRPFFRYNTFEETKNCEKGFGFSYEKKYSLPAVGTLPVPVHGSRLLQR